MTRASLLLVGFALACGGQSAEAPGAGGAGGGATGGAGGAGGGGGGAGASCGIPPYYCVPAMCGGDVVTAPSCDSGVWGDCPEGYVPPSQCPDDACFHPPVFSCCDALGHTSKPTCPGQAAEVCPPDAYLWMSMGMPCPAAGTFPCGEAGLTCKLGQEYCRRASGSASCEPLPAGCGSAPDCACLAAVACECHDAGLDALSVYCN